MAPTWKVLNKVGEGPTSEVYRAVSPEGAAVAVKVLVRAAGENLPLFEKQARLLSRLKHPSIVSLSGYSLKSDAIFGKDRGPVYWMDYIEGKDLLAAAQGADAQKILSWFRESLEALRFVHAQGIVHGDLSPKNLLIDARGSIRLLDFSILPGDPSTAEVTTLPYMAPERIHGQSSAAADLFSLGTIFYEALAGRHPRAGCQTVQELIRREPLSLSEATPYLKGTELECRILDRMIRADAGERLGDAGKILEVLAQGRWEEASSSAPTGYDPVLMVGAKRASAQAEEILDGIREHPVAIGVRGPVGVGKSRFCREIAFEAALRSIEVRHVPNLHQASPAARAALVTFLRTPPPKPMLITLEWNDEGDRFFEALVGAGLVREIRLQNLSREDSRALISGALNVESIESALDVLFDRTKGNPRELLDSLQRLASHKKIRDRALLPGWKEILEEKEKAVEPEDPVELSRYLRQEINRLNGLGRYVQALEVADRWFALQAEDEAGPLKTVKYWFVTGLNHLNLDHPGEALRRLRKCLEEGKGHFDDRQIRPYLVRAHSHLGVHSLKRGLNEEALAEFQRALEFAEDAERAEILRNMARSLSRLGRWTEGRKALEEAKGIYRKEGHREGEFWALIEEGNLWRENEDADATARAYEQAERISRENAWDLPLAIARNNRGLLERARGNLAQALEELTQAHETFRFLGNANDLAQNLKELAVVEAEVGRFRAAEERLKALRQLSSSFSGATVFADEAQAAILNLREGKTGETRQSLETLFAKLSPELQITFVDRLDYQNALKRSERKEDSMGSTQLALSKVLPTLTLLNEELLLEEDMGRVLNRLMDAAMQLAGAEKGFLVLRSKAAIQGPLPGYEVAVARNLSKDEVETDTYAFSLSAVKRALKTGETLVTDNALLDPLFRDAKSIHLRQLKSILALPVKDQEGVLGVFYLDHRFEDGLFEGDLLEAMKAFASVASLALQKDRLIAALKENNEELTDRVKAQTKEINRSRLILKNEYSEIIGRSPKMVEVLSMTDKITDSKVPVWIYGESGTGKEAIARALHFNSLRSKKPFVTENCSALPESLLESELFGHKKGAFTHAVADKKGILQYADGGTIFLDEIGDMSLGLQAKLLRFLQEGEIRPIGSPEVIRVDVRVVSASNKDLPALVAEGKFREDLFYRLNGVTVKLPPLRERMEDLPLLADHFLKKIAEREKKKPCRLSPDTLRLFMEYLWPGNIRELQNTLETSVLFADKDSITPQSLQFKPALLEGKLTLFKATRPATETGYPPTPRRGDFVEAGGRGSTRSAGSAEGVLTETLRAIRDNAYHKGYAAEALGITRRALYARLKKFGLATDVKALKAKIEESSG